MSKAYKDAGVDIHAGYEAVKLIKRDVESTYTEGVLRDAGGFGSGFGGMFSLAAVKDMDDPVMVSGTDSVGTKIMLAFQADVHDTVGIDCVAMCVNDIVCCGAKPLFFLDYIGLGKNVPERTAKIVAGVAEGCRQAGAAIVGGEMAEMPGVYKEDEYDLVGFAAGVVDRKNIIDGRNIKEGDVLVGLASSGFHSNGFSLVRKVFANHMKEHIKTLLTPTKIYVKAILGLMEKVNIKGVSNITGGGLVENVPRMMPDGLKAVIKAGSWDVPPIFGVLKKLAKENGNEISELDMLNTFNMGVGMVLAVDKADAEKAVAALNELGEKAFVIGDVVKQEKFAGGVISTEARIEDKGVEICLK